MGKRITQYQELNTLTGNEVTILAYRGDNYTTKLSTIIALAIGTESSFNQIEAQVNLNKAAIQSMNDTVSLVAVNLNNTMGRISIIENNLSNLSANYATLSTKVSTDEASITQLIADMSIVNQAIFNLQQGEIGEVQASLVFDQADW